MELFLILAIIVGLVILAVCMDAARRHRHRERYAPTERQLAFIATLMDERDCDHLDLTPPRSKQAASALIDRLLKCPKLDDAKSEAEILLEIRDLLQDLHGKVFDVPK